MVRGFTGLPLAVVVSIVAGTAGGTCILVGRGILRLRPWARVASLWLLGCSMVVGSWVIRNALILYRLNLPPDSTASLIAVVIFLVPQLVVVLYLTSRKVKAQFQDK